MESIDIKVFGLITLATLTLVGALKKSFENWVKGKEPLLALAIPVILTIAAKSGGLFKGTEWVDALTWAFGMGLTAGVAHDKITNPLMKNKKPKEEEAE